MLTDQNTRNRAQAAIFGSPLYCTILCSVVSVVGAGCTSGAKGPETLSAGKDGSQTETVDGSRPAHGGSGQGVGDARSDPHELREAYLGAADAHSLEEARRRFLDHLIGRFAGLREASADVPARTRVMLFVQLMRDWNPIGSNVRDLKAIAGAPTRETKDEVTYSFQTAFAARQWVFYIEDEDVVGVRFFSH